MTPFSAIDLEKLPAPDIIETLDFETILGNMVDDLQIRMPELTINVESDPVYKIWGCTRLAGLIPCKNEDNSL